ncbi:MAG: Crp/Fnr family transcriptional regulator [Zoogloeaceae bacterium]|jgi:CRP-like cAMP-binding protein|nr:Crp/Fnr family transcriptional regulator [Zoogloeaceae bacterium]
MPLGFNVIRKGGVNIPTLLATVPAFSSWPLWAREGLARNAFVRQYPRSANVIAFGAQPRELLVILEGALVVSEHCRDSSREIRCLPHPGEIMGLICVLQGMPFAFDLSAHESSRLLHIPQENLWEVLTQEPRLIASLLEQILQRMKMAMPRNSGDSPSQCLARVLWRLARTYGKPTDKGIRIGIRLSQDDLSMFLSCSRQTINKEVRRLVEQGVIAKSYNTITVIDMEWLARQQENPLWQPSLSARTPLMEALKLEP